MRERRAHKTWRIALLLLQCLWLFVAGGLQAQQDAAPATAPPGASDSTYNLSSGDMVRINVFNQPDLSGDYLLDGEGRFSMPLIGSVEAEGLTPSELERLLVDKYRPDYLVNPRIFIQVMNYRPYYLMGEVRGTGAFPYQAGMTYLTAIAIAGGFTYRAKQGHVIVIRGDDPEQNELKLSVEEKVQPGDIIRVEERLF
jgi:polysaccharide export outer membrane protein